MKKYQLTILGMSIAAFLWGASFYAIKNLMPMLSYQVLTLLRFLLATLALGVWRVTKGEREKIERCDWLRVGGSGLLGGAVYFLLSTKAIEMLSPMDLSVVSGMQPILMMIIECLVIGTLFTGKESMSIAISVMGSILLIERININCGIGLYILQVTATFVWCIYYVIQKPLVQKYRVTTLIFFQSLISTIFLFLFTWKQLPVQGGIGIKEWGALIYLGVGGIAIAYSLNAYALKSLSPTAISLFLNAGPIINMFWGWFFLKEAVKGRQMIGATLVIVGVVQVLREWMKKDKINQ